MIKKSLTPSKRFTLQKISNIVPYLTQEEIHQITNYVKTKNRKGERDELLILTLFQTGLRISEALSLTPRSISPSNNHFVINIKGKNKKLRMVACPNNLAHRLKSYAYTKNIKPEEKIFNINRKRAWQIIKQAGEKAINKKVWPHLLRHSDAIERLRQTGNPKALQYHLGHSSPLMTMRYLTTLTAEEALKIQQGVRFER